MKENHSQLLLHYGQKIEMKMELGDGKAKAKANWS